jgi:hypothetical protein
MVAALQPQDAGMLILTYCDRSMVTLPRFSIETVPLEGKSFMAAAAADEVVTLAVHCTGSVSFRSSDTLTMQVQLPLKSLLQLLLLNADRLGVTTISLQMTGTFRTLNGPVKLIVKRAGQASPFSKKVTLTLALGASFPDRVE